MLFLVSAALRFHLKPTAECAVRSTPRLASKAKALAQELRKLEAKDIKKQLHVNDALAKEYATHLGSFEAQKPVPACALYDSRLWQALNAASFDQEDAEWANAHVRVLSGLYGVLRPFDEIQPLGLPVALHTKLTTSKGKFLRDYWKETLRKELADSLQRLPMPVIINLALEEDTLEILGEDVLPESTRVATVEFKTIEKEDAAEAKGEFLRWALESRCMNVEDLLQFRGLVDEGEEATYRVSPKAASSKDGLVFEEAIGEGSSGGWTKKLAESGMSKNAFIKEFASSKDRYKRTEINKAFVKENKKNRKHTAVF